jgi:hypothetical protein
MSIEVTITAEAAIFDIYGSRDWGHPERHRSEEVLFNSVQDLPKLPHEKPVDYNGTKLYWITYREAWVGFNFSSWYEGGAVGIIVAIKGPYLILNESPPSKEQIAEAAQDGRLFTLQKDCYI